MSVEKSSVLAEKRTNTTKMSDLIRYVSFGLLAVYYSILTSDSDFAKLIISNSSTLLQLIAIAGVGAILCDYIQYWCGAKNSEASLASPLLDEHGNPSDEYTYPDDVFKKLRLLFFRVKQGLTFAGVVILIIVIFCNKP